MDYMENADDQAKFDELAKLRRLKELQDMQAAQTQESVMDSVGQEPTTMQKIGKYIPDGLKNAVSAVPKGLASLPAMVADVGAWVDSPKRSAEMLENTLAQKKSGESDWVSRLISPLVSPSNEQTIQRIQELKHRQAQEEADPQPSYSEKVQKFGYQPKTQGERYVDQAIQSGVGMLTSPSSWIGPAKAVMTGAVAGTAGEAGAHAFKGSEAEPYARVAAALAGGLGTSLALSQQRNARSVAQEVGKSMSEGDYKTIQKMMIRSGKGGVDLNASQALPENANLSKLVQALVVHRQGAPLIQQLENQPQQVSTLMGRLQKALPGDVKTPSAIANESQQAATNTLSAARQSRTEAVKPLYEAAGNVPVQYLEQLSKQLADKLPRVSNTAGDLLSGLKGKVDEFITVAKGKPSGLLDAYGNPIITPAAPVAMEEFNRSLRSISAEQKALNTASKAFDKEAVGGLQSAISGIRKELGDIDPNFSAGNALYKHLTDTKVNPLKKSVVGTVAGVNESSDTREAANKLLGILAKGTNPKAVNSDILKYAVETTDKTDPFAFANAVKTHISNAVEGVEQSSTGALPSTFAESVRKKLIGTPTQHKGLQDMLAGVAHQTGNDPELLVKGFTNGMQLVEAAAKRPSSVGLSAEEIRKMAGESKLASGVQLLSLNAGNQAGKGLRGFVTANAYKELAELLTTPEGMTTFQKLATMPVMSNKAKALLDTALATMNQRKAVGLQQSNTIGVQQGGEE
jgi:hypothetical protein